MELKLAWSSKIYTMIIDFVVLQSDQKQSAIFETVFDNKRYTMK